MNVDALRSLYTFCCAIPAQSFKLSEFYDEYGKCGCALGYAAKNKMQGLWLGKFSLPAYLDTVTGTTHSGMDAAAKAFGIDHWDAVRLFAGPGFSSYDEGLVGTMSDKDLWCHRMEQFFKDNNEPLMAVEVYEDQPKMIAYVFV